MEPVGPEGPKGPESPGIPKALWMGICRFGPSSLAALFWGLFLGWTSGPGVWVCSFALLLASFARAFARVLAFVRARAWAQAVCVRARACVLACVFACVRACARAQSLRAFTSAPGLGAMHGPARAAAPARSAVNAAGA